MSLNPAILTLLRASVRAPKPSDGTFAKGLGAFLTYDPSAGGRWELHAYGRLQARSEDSAPLRAMILREALEPGWIALALSPTLNPEDALRSRADRHATELSQREAMAAAEASRAAAEDAEWRKRRIAAFDPAAITLDDLE